MEYIMCALMIKIQYIKLLKILPQELWMNKDNGREDHQKII